jgi:hypothetical protein
MTTLKGGGTVRSCTLAEPWSGSLSNPLRDAVPPPFGPMQAPQPKRAVGP